MSRLWRFFAILIAAYAAAGCFSPVGSVGGSDADHLFVMPKRVQYKTGERFVPIDDLEVHASYQGVEEIVPLDEVTIRIAEPPYHPNNLINVPFDKGYVLDKPGSNVVVVEYGDLSNSYSIEVLAAAGNNTRPGIHIEWAH